MVEKFVHHERETLKKAIPFRNYIAIGLGVIVGVGWVIMSGQFLEDGGPLGAMIAFALGGLLLLSVGTCYAEMTSSLPLAGGELSFAYKAFGSLMAFIIAWMLALGYISITPFETIAIGQLLETLIPAIASDALYHVDLGNEPERVALSTILPGLLVGVYLIWLNYKGAKNSAKFQLFVVYGMVACTVIFTVAALFKGDISNLQPLFAGTEDYSSQWAAAPAAIVSVLVVVPFFMAGFDAIPQAAEESGTSMQPRQLGIAILVSIVTGAFFYVLIILAVAMAMPWTISSKLPMTTSAVFEEAFGFAWAAKLVIFTALLGLITTLNGMYIASSRVLFSMARGGLLPHWFAEVHPLHHTPKNAMLFVGVISLLGPFVGKSALTPIVNCASLVFTIAMAITCASTIRLRSLAPGLERPFRAPTPLIYLGMLVAIVLISLMVLPQSPGQLGNLEFTISGIWFLLGLPLFFWRQYQHPVPKDERDYLILGDYR